MDCRYKRGELTGKNVSIIMPPPFSTRHNTFLRNYTTTGRAKILDTLREVRSLGGLLAQRARVQ